MQRGRWEHEISDLVHARNRRWGNFWKITLPNSRTILSSLHAQKKAGEPTNASARNERKWLAMSRALDSRMLSDRHCIHCPLRKIFRHRTAPLVLLLHYDGFVVRLVGTFEIIIFLLEVTRETNHMHALCWNSNMDRSWTIQLISQRPFLRLLRVRSDCVQKWRSVCICGEHGLLSTHAVEIRI